MRIMYLREKKHHEKRKENPYHWSFWQIKYAVDFSKHKGFIKRITYKAYIQGEKQDWYDDYYSTLELHIYKTIHLKPTKTSSKLSLSRKVADLRG